MVRKAPIQCTCLWHTGLEWMKAVPRVAPLEERTRQRGVPGAAPLAGWTCRRMLKFFQAGGLNVGEVEKCLIVCCSSDPFVMRCYGTACCTVVR